MKLPASSEEELLIRRGRSDCGDASDSEKNGSIENEGKPPTTGTPLTMKKSSSLMMGAPSIR
jgi:hypothetical protein